MMIKTVTAAAAMGPTSLPRSSFGGGHLRERDVPEVDGVGEDVEGGDGECAEEEDAGELFARVFDFTGDRADIGPAVVRPHDGGHDGDAGLEKSFG